MRVLIVSDIHGNLPAFEAVLADAEQRGGFETIWCLGDTVGYGAQPNECLDRLRQYPLVSLVGNHDLGAIGRLSLDDFNAHAAVANRWTGQVLTEDNRTFLAGLPPKLIVDDWTLAHGTPQEPVWEYLVSELTAAEALAALETPLGLVGHSHLPLIAERHPEPRPEASGPSGPLSRFSVRSRVEITLTTWQPEVPQDLAGRMAIFNPGSVGQPRDYDPRAGYALLDRAAGVLTHYRVPYEIQQAQRLILEAGLPPMLADRLEEGW